VSGDDAWTDLLDPSADELQRHAPAELHPRAVEELVRAGAPAQPPRPTIEGHGDYVFGLLLAPVAVPAEDRTFVQEVLFVLTRDRLLTVRKTPPGGEEPFDPSAIQAVCAMRDDVPPGMIAFHLVDEVAERYLDLLDALGDEIDELEAGVDTWPAEQTHSRLAELRQDVIHIRKTLGPTREAVRGIVDGRTDIEGRPLFRREVFPLELHFAQAYDKLLRANEGLEFARELIGSVRDYQRSLVAAEQNRVTKTLTVIASLVLFPTFIVGVYGQNFDNMPELGWRFGYLFSWGVIALVTIAQLAFFRWRRWI
jgi:magnesium transporter